MPRPNSETYELSDAEKLKNGKSEVVCDCGQLIKVSKDKTGVVTRDTLTKHWTDWIDYWAVDFDYQSRKEIIKVAKRMGVDDELPGIVQAGEELLEFEERWTGAYIFENEWQSFRTRKNRALELRCSSLRETRTLHCRGKGHRHFRQRYHDARAGECGRLTLLCISLSEMRVGSPKERLVFREKAL